MAPHLLKRQTHIPLRWSTRPNRHRNCCGGRNGLHLSVNGANLGYTFWAWQGLGLREGHVWAKSRTWSKRGLLLMMLQGSVESRLAHVGNVVQT
ncbi:hypothetical protein PIB30_095771 [Stylosanthes scabra]|uniref:Uncharacterized protein n=1 Tax=Stylosanthes scabra TaxID=79078 RepID=A0ABU6UWZ9_9FABA|nr:hypothetical protein [Stylosanthes scabra]